MKVLLLVCIFFLGYVNPSLHESNSSLFLAPDAVDVQYAPIGAKRCMKELGCFEITPDFYNALKRPINLLPQDRVSISTKFHLYTKVHPMEVHYLASNDPKGMKESGIDPNHTTVFIVHGFFDNTLYGKWMETMKTNLMLYGNYNVILVDWSKGNGAPYTQAVANTRVVGAEIALLIEKLQKVLGFSSMKCHIVGHSLGAHIAGYAGERLKKLGRITALDPAQPYFQDMPPSVRIDPTDADFVDVIHTDSSSNKFLALGMSQAVGHIDFFPNNGMNQPGCTVKSRIFSIFLEGLFDAARQIVACNHQRSVDYFIYSLNFKKSQPVSHHCMNWNDYLSGRCSDCGKKGERCAVMGMKADQYKKFKNDSQSIKMYLATSGSQPFWVYNYQISIKLAKPEGYKDRSGSIELKIRGSRNDYDIELPSRTLIHGATYSFFVSKQEELGEMKDVSFKWINKGLTIISKPVIYIDFVKITPMNSIDPIPRDKNTRAFCYQPKKPIQSKQNVLLSKCS